MKWTHLAAGATISIGCASCSLFQPAGNYATVFRKVQLDQAASAPVSVVLDAYQRTVISKYGVPHGALEPARSATSNSSGGASTAAGAVTDSKFMVNCSEPSPDVFGVIAGTASIAAQQSSSASSPSASLAASLATAVTQNASEMQRAQVIQLLRDKMFNACLAYSNGALSGAQYQRMLSSTGEASVVLVALAGLLPQAPAELNKIEAGQAVAAANAAAASAAVQSATAASAASAAAQSAKAAQDAASAASASKTKTSATPASSISSSLDLGQSSAAAARRGPAFGAPLLSTAYLAATGGVGGHLLPVADTQGAAPTQAAPTPAAAAASSAAQAPSKAAKPGAATKTANKSAPPKAAPPVQAAAAPADPAPAPPASADSKSQLPDNAPIVENIVNRYLAISMVHDCLDYWRGIDGGEFEGVANDYIVQSACVSVLQWATATPPTAGRTAALGSNQTASAVAPASTASAPAFGILNSSEFAARFHGFAPGSFERKQK